MSFAEIHRNQVAAIFHVTSMVWNKSQGSTLVLLLGGCESVRDNPLYQFWTPERIDIGNSELSKKERKNAVSQLEKEIRLWEADFSLIQQFFISKGCIMFGSHPTKPREYKGPTLDIIKKFFATPAKNYVLYWSGHTLLKNQGWCFVGQETLHLPELLSLFRAEFNPYKEERTLIIIGDTCCSGSWCKELNDMDEYELNVIIQAGCLENEKSFVVDGHKPRSNLMCRMLTVDCHGEDNNNKISEKEDEKLQETTLWKPHNQHPNFTVSKSLMEKNYCEFIKGDAEDTCFYEQFRFFQIHPEWTKAQKTL